MFLRLTLAIVAASFAMAAGATTFDSTYYHARYGLKDPYAKRIDNMGNGYDPLYGLRNVREVLKGVLYRGGANNFYNKHQKRANSNPLPNEGLDNLCAEGFKTGVYLYATNYSKAPHQLDCRSLRGANHLDYVQIDPKSKPEDILKLVFAAIFNRERGPIYVHCWNGWHASGLIAALSLRQFCGVSADDAVKYWVKNVDGNDFPSMQPIKTLIRNFQPRSDLLIGPSVQAEICPQL
jgi:hypothetical protein